MMNILIIEDDVTSGKVLSRILQRYGTVTITTNGRLGLDSFKDALNNNTPYDLIFLDIMMPEIDGQEVLREIRKTEEMLGICGFDGVKILMTTALDDNKNIMQAFRSQCEGYLVKPILKDKVHAEIKRLFDESATSV
jgi:two-component system chemotaxis response regulator CheY